MESPILRSNLILHPSIASSQVDSARRVCRIAVAADRKFKRYGSLNARVVQVTLHMGDLNNILGAGGSSLAKVLLILM